MRFSCNSWSDNERRWGRFIQPTI